MSLLNKVANREIFDFLKTLTVKSTYFADKIRSTQIRSAVNDRVPETANPYVIHLAGEYVLSDLIVLNNGRAGHDDLFRPSNDTAENHSYNKAHGLIKNFWRFEEDGSYKKLSVDELESVLNPAGEGLYEYKPFIVEGVIDPVTGLAEDQVYLRSQCIYDREGNLSEEMRYVDYLNDDCFDEMMYVTSLDTQQEIPFTLENFYQADAEEAYAQGRRKYTGIHSKTLEAYRVPGRYFDLLCKRYPKQVDLIKAIVYRVPTRKLSSLVSIKELENILQKNQYATPEYLASLEKRFPNKRDLMKKLASDLEGSRTNDSMTESEVRRTRIAKAENFELLCYNLDNLDETENISLLEHTQHVLDIIKRRWAVNEYNFEENYAAVLWTVLWTVLPTALIAKRYANIKTPYVSESHMWDYLNSRGLDSYRGYLTTKQTWFLYKNIEYLFQHAGQQKALNILIDNLLSDYGLTITAKTVVLDTTDSLSTSTKPTDPLIQCESCSRRCTTCFKNMTEHLCDEWLGTKTLCKAEPVVLTEEFAGASKEKIIRRLKKDYGYTDAAAEVKYKRSFIWRDEDVEAIKDDLNRDQMVDVNQHVDTLEDTIDAEHSSGQEPVVNDDIIDEQRKLLQHMHGTYAPTKLLEMKKKAYNVKFTDLFNRFITDTLLRFAPRVNDDGTVTRKVTCSYKFSTTEGASDYIFNYGEILAAGYLGFVREYVVDAFVDEVLLGSDGKPLYETVVDEEGNPIQIDTDAEGNPIYLKKLSSWIQNRFTDLMTKISYDFAIPNKCVTTTALRFGKPVKQDELVNTWMTGESYPEYLEKIVQTSDTIVKADKTYYIVDRSGEYHEVELTPGTDLSESKIQYYQKLVTNSDDLTKVLCIRDTLYAVTQIDDPETFCLTPDTVVKEDKRYYKYHGGNLYSLADVTVGDPITEADALYEEDSIWGEFAIRLKILGEIGLTKTKSGESNTYFENDDEIPIIPKFFKWYYSHLNPEIDATEEEKESMKVGTKLARKRVYSSLGELSGYEPVNNYSTQSDDADHVFEDGYPEDPCHQDSYLHVDTSRRQDYRLFILDQFLDVGSLIDRWVDMTGTISDQSEIANYIDIMFEILEEVYCFASTSSSVRVHMACRTFLECIIKHETIRFDLTGLDCTHTTTEGTKCAWYSEWLNNDKELQGSFNVIDKLDDTAAGWNEFNTEVVKALLDGCTIQYASDIINKTQYNKLKQLVVSLSSYRITFIDNAESSQVCNDMAAITEDALIDKITTDDVIYFDPIGDSTIPPRVGGYEQTDSDGNILVPTSDLRRVADKTYYTLGYKDSHVYDNPDENQVLHPVARPLGNKGEDVPEGTVLSVGSEAINLPYVTEFKFYRYTEDKYVLQDKTYSKYIPLTGGYVPVGLDYFTTVKTSEITEELPENVLKGKDAEENEIVYKIDVAFEPIQVGECLPTGRCFEKINLYTILGISAGTPLIISKINNRWYYSIGTSVPDDYRLTGDSVHHASKQYYIYLGNGLYRPTTDADFEKGEFIEGVDYYELSVIPGSQANVNDENFNDEMKEAGDRFDLKNDFSNETAKSKLDSVIYRLNVPITRTDWSDPVQSSVLEQWLYPNVNHEFTIVNSTEPSLLIQESEYPEIENKESQE